MKGADLEVSTTSIEITHRILDQPNLKRAIILVCNMVARRTNTGNDPAPNIRKEIITRQDHLIVQLSLQTANPWEQIDRRTNNWTNRTLELTRRTIKGLREYIATKVRKPMTNNMSLRKWGTILMRVRPDKEKTITRTRWIKAVLTNKDLSKLPMKNPFTKAT